MDQHGKSPARNKRRNRFKKKKNQEARKEQNNSKHEVQDGREGVVRQHDQSTTTQNAKQVQVQQQNDKQQVNLGQPMKQDCSQYKEKAKKQQGDNEPVSSKKVNFKFESETLRSQKIQELKQRVGQQLDETEKLLVKQLQDFNKTQQSFNIRAFFSGQNDMSCEERAREIEKAVQAVTEGAKKFSGKSAPGDQERRMQDICFRYDELRQVLERLEALENMFEKNEAGHQDGTNDTNAKTSATKGETNQGFPSNDKEDNKRVPGRSDDQNVNLPNSSSFNPKKIEQPCHSTSKQTGEQHVTPNNLKKTQNLPGKINNSSEICFGGSHPGVMNIERGDETVGSDVHLSSSPLDEDQRSVSSNQQLSSDDSNESLAFQAFSAPMKFLRRVKKKFGNFLFSPKKEKAKDSDHDDISNVSCDNIDVEARAGTSRDVSGPCLSQPVQRAFLEFQNDTAYGKANNRRGLEEILITPESPAVLSSKTTAVKGREAKQTERGRPTALVNQGTGPKEVKNGMLEKNVANKNVPKKEALPSQETSQPNRTESGKNKFTAEANRTGTGGSSQRVTAKKNDKMQSVAATGKEVLAMSQNGVPVDKQKSDVGKNATPSKGLSHLPTTPQRTMKQTPSGYVPVNVNQPAANTSNTTPKGFSKSGAVAHKNVLQVPHQNTTTSSASPKNVPGKTSISTKPVGVSASKPAVSVASVGTRVPNKNQSNRQQQAVPQKEQRKDTILKSPTQGVVTKGTLSEEKKMHSPGKKQERKDTIAQVVVTIKTPATPNPRQNGTAKKDSDMSSAIHKQENYPGESKSPKGLTKKEKPSPSKVPQIAASLPPSTKTSPLTNQTTNAHDQEVKSTNSERELNQDNTQASSPYERRILKARRRIVFEENKNPASTGPAGLSDTGEVDYETVMPEDFEQAVAEAMDDDRFSEQTSSTEKLTNRHVTGNCSSSIPLQDIPETSALEISVDVQETPPPSGRKKKYRGKYAAGFSNLRKSINCCCEFDCDYCVPSWEWDKVVANQRKKR